MMDIDKEVFMKKKFKKGIMLAVLTSVILSGCKAAGMPNTVNKSGKETTAEEVIEVHKKYSSIEELKKKYASEECFEIKPLYNLPKDMKFTFRFHSEIDPYKAVTIHTDRKCEANSMISVVSGGFSTPDGVDVLIVPSTPVLDCVDRLDYGSSTYGYAPIYYLCIRYDLDASIPTKLEEPIVIPFTIKGDVQTPTAYPGISQDGTFYVKWNPVDGADGYRIYEAYADADEYERLGSVPRRENAYVGEHLHLLAELPADQTEFHNFGKDGQENTILDTEENVYIQNAFDLNNYYVTAVKDGKESFFSQEVSGWKYNNQLPKQFDSYYGFTRDGLNVTELPETVEIQMVDGSKTSMPINFRKIDGTYETLEGGNDTAVYEYDIPGTKLRGKITYHSENKNYPNEILSTIVPNYGMYSIDTGLDIIPAPDIPTIDEETIGNRYVDLSKSAKYYKDSMIIYDEEALMKRADMDAERLLCNGQYQQDPFSLNYVKSYGIPMEPVVDIVVEETSAEVQMTESVEETQRMEEESSAVETIESIQETTLESSVDETQEELPTQDENEITSVNIIEEQINSTRDQVANSNSEQYEVSGYPSFAASPEEEFVAENMINRNEQFSVQAFPKLQDMEILQDVLMKVYYQNPYVFGFENAAYNAATKEVMIRYNMSKEEIQKRQSEVDQESDRILNKILTDSMTDEEKVEAIYKYLENNTVYDNEALAMAESNGFSDVSGFEDSFNTYGILCNKKGVCQSYAYTVNLLSKKAGINSIMLTGYMSKTLPHAWNAIEYDGKWYWIDATNNGKSSGIPYLLYQTSSITAEDMDYILDDGFELNSNLSYVVNVDDSKDWYVKTGLVANSEDELIEKLVSTMEKGKVSAVRYTFNLQLDDSFVIKLGEKILDKDSHTDLNAIKFGTAMNYFMMAYE